MSVQAMSWAIEQQEVKNPTLRLLLLCVANYASTAGKNAFPSVAVLVDNSGLSESTVRRGLDKLEEYGVLIRGNQAVAAAEIGRADRCPVVYDLPILRGVTVLPRSSNGVSNDPPRGVKDTSTGCQALTPNPKRSEENHKSAERGVSPEPRRRPDPQPAPTTTPQRTLKDALAEREKPVQGRAPNFKEEFRRRFGVDPP